LGAVAGQQPMKTQQDLMRGVVNRAVCELAIELQLVVVASFEFRVRSKSDYQSKPHVQPVTRDNINIYTHTHDGKWTRNSFSDVTIHLAAPFIMTPQKTFHVPKEEKGA
jgi:hypothetical protein